MPEENLTLRNAPSQSTNDGPSFEEGPLNHGAGTNLEIEPVTNESMPQIVLDVLGISENLMDLPSDMSENAKEISDYLSEQLKTQGKTPNVLTIGKKLDEIKEELEMDDDTDLSVVMDRIGGVVKAWKNLGFMKDASQKRTMFMKLARCKDSREMHKLVFKNYEQSGAWQ